MVYLNELVSSQPKTTASTTKGSKGCGVSQNCYSFRPPGNAWYTRRTGTGFVSLTGAKEDQRPVRILRHRWFSLSFLLTSCLSVLRPQGMLAHRYAALRWVTYPLHYPVFMSGQLISGVFEVAVRYSFPIPGVEFIMANDIAGKKVLPSAEVVNTPVTDPEMDEVWKSQSVFCASVLTRSQAQKQKEATLADSRLTLALAEDKLPLADLDPAPPEQDLTSPSILPPLPSTRESLIKAQKADASLAKCFESVTELADEKMAVILHRRWDVNAEVGLPTYAKARGNRLRLGDCTPSCCSNAVPIASFASGT